MREGRYLDRRKEVKTTFEDAVKRFIAWSEVNVRPATYKNDRHYAELWLSSGHFAGKRLNKITAVDVEAYKAQRVTGPNKVSQLRTDADLRRFWAQATGSLSLSTEDVHKLLGLPSIYLWPGTLDDALHAVADRAAEAADAEVETE